jgi:hypothetical protein
MPNEFIARNGITSLGNVVVTGSLTTTGTINMSGSIASASFASSASNAVNASTASSADNFLVRSTLTAQTLVVQTITSSVDFVTGSTRFGSISENTHQFTGSVNITGSLALAGNITSNGTAVVLGSGTTNYLPKFTGASTIGNSLVFDNGTSVVIGTATPATNYILTLRTQSADYTKVLDWGTAAGGSWGNMTINISAPYQTILNSGAWQFNISGTQKMLLDTSGNLGLGVTPSAWRNLFTAFQVGYTGALYSTTVTTAGEQVNLASNYYQDSAGNELRIQAGYATRYQQASGQHIWSTAGTSSAGSGITFTQAMTLTAAGELLINTTDAGNWKLQVNGNAYLTNTNAVGYTFLTIGNSGASGRSYDIGVGGNGVGSPYQNSFYIYDNIAGQPRFYINSTGAATFSSSVTANKFISNATDDGIGQYFWFTGNAAVSSNFSVYAYSNNVYINAYQTMVIRANQGTTGGSIQLSGGSVLFQKTAVNNTDTGAGWFQNDYFCVTNNSADSGDRVVLINRQNSDGTLIDFRQANASEGSISVSGTTVSYNGGHLSRYSQTELNQKIEGLLKGTVMSNLDKMAQWINPETGEPYANEQLNCMKISDVEGDKNVAGVFVNWEYDSELLTNDMNIAMTGDMIIRIAQGVVVEKGDLLISVGDGTAKPQEDDIVRSNTIAKVTSNHITCVYEDGSYCVPCVLMAC